MTYRHSEIVWFHEHPVQLDLPNDGKRMLQPYAYWWRHKGIEHSWVIPVGFEHNGASIPRLVRSAIDPAPFARAAPFHDRGYHFNGWLPEDEHMMRDPDTGDWYDAHRGLDGTLRRPWTRSDLDRLFFRMLREDPMGPPSWQRRVAYWAVRIGGLRAWHNANGVTHV